MALRPGQRESTANISGIYFGRSASGNEQVAITCECLDGEDAGASLIYFGSFSPNALAYTEAALRATGWTGDDVAELPELATAGKLGPVKLVITDEARPDGRVFPKIVFINKPAGSSKFEFKADRKLEGAELRSFGARMKSAFSSSKAKPAPTPAPKPAPARAGRAAGHDSGRGRVDDHVPPPSDADLPFD